MRRRPSPPQTTQPIRASLALFSHSLLLAFQKSTGMAYLHLSVLSENNIVFLLWHTLLQRNNIVITFQHIEIKFQNSMYNTGLFGR